MNPSGKKTVRGKTRALTADELRDLARFRHALRSFLAFSEAKTRAAGVTPQQYQALLAIKAHEKDEVVIGDLAKDLFLAHNGAVQLVDRLAAANLVRRRSSPKDRRVAILTLTAKGEEKLALLASLHLRQLVASREEWGSLTRLASQMHRKSRS